MELNETHAEALEARGIDRDLAARYQVHSVSGGGTGSAAAFGYVREGALVNRKYRTALAEGDKGKIWQDKGGIKCLWNEDVLRDDSLLDQPLIITEGEIDALSVLAAGFSRVVSVPDGAPATTVEDPNSAKYSFLDGVRSLLSQERVSTIILAVDNDAAGANLLHDLSIRLGRYRCKFLTYPRNPDDPDSRLKDLNQVLVRFGPKGVQKTIERSSFLRVDGVYRMSELPPPPEAPIYETGFDRFQDNYKVRLGDFVVVTGIPSMGKSTFVNDLCCRLVSAHGLGVAFASFEQMPTRDHRRNLRTWYLQRPVPSAETSDVAAADRWIDANFSFLVPSEDDDVNVDWVLDRCEAAVVQHGVKVIVIDPWNEMDHAREAKESITEYTGRAIKAFKRFAKKFMVHLIVVAHPSKQQKDKDGVYAIPSLYDISDSSHWYNKADVGVVVHRDVDGRSILRTAKSRYHDEIGVPGEVYASFDFYSRRYTVAPL
jgi:twinkle protein